MVHDDGAETHHSDRLETVYDVEGDRSAEIGRALVNVETALSMMERSDRKTAIIRRATGGKSSMILGGAVRRAEINPTAAPLDVVSIAPSSPVVDGAPVGEAIADAMRLVDAANPVSRQDVTLAA